MAIKKNYICSAQAGCDQNFTKYTDLKRHEATHSKFAYYCRFPGCNFATLLKTSFEIHSDKHTGTQRYSCPHDCDFKTHNPAILTCHRKKEHGHNPRPRRHLHARALTNAASAIDIKPLRPFQPQPQPQPQPQAQPQPQPQPQFQFQAQPQPQFQPQPQVQPRPQFPPQPQPPAPQPYQNNYNHMLGAFNGRPDIVQYYTAPVRAANGWQPPAGYPPYQYYYYYYPQPGVPAYPANDYHMYPAPAGAANGWPAGYPYGPY